MLCCPEQALCINEAVLALGSTQRINERCLDLQSGSGAQRKKRAAAATVAGAKASAPAAAKASCGGCPFRKANKTSLRHLKACTAPVPGSFLCFHTARSTRALCRSCTHMH